MREFIKTYEFIGKLKIGDEFEEENVRCIYKDDYYSNKIMEGDFKLKDLSSTSIKYLSRKFDNFIFEDENGRTIKGKITGLSLKSEYNSRDDSVSFKADDFTQWLLWNDNSPIRLKIRFYIPYISLFSREIQFSHGFYEEYIFKFSKQKFKLKLDFCDIAFDDWVYAREYKEPDSILCKELYLEIEKEIKDSEEIISSITKIEIYVDDLMLIISFIINHRVASYGYYVELQDINGKNTETIEYKKHNRLIGNDYLEDIRNMKFLNLFKEEYLNKLINSFFINNKEDNGQIKRILYSYLTVNEIKVFEPQFLSAYFLLEAISKLIVKPKSKTNSERLIKSAAELMNVNLNNYDFKISRHRLIKATSENEWEITEYRNNLTHFNNLKFDNHETYEEYRKIMKLSRELILAYLEPSLSDWPEP